MISSFCIPSSSCQDFLLMMTGNVFKLFSFGQASFIISSTGGHKSVCNSVKELFLPHKPFEWSAPRVSLRKQWHSSRLHPGLFLWLAGFRTRMDWSTRFLPWSLMKPTNSSFNGISQVGGQLRVLMSNDYLDQVGLSGTETLIMLLKNGWYIF